MSLTFLDFNHDITSLIYHEYLGTYSVSLAMMRQTCRSINSASRRPFKGKDRQHSAIDPKLLDGYPLFMIETILPTIKASTVDVSAWDGLFENAVHAGHITDAIRLLQCFAYPFASKVLWCNFSHIVTVDLMRNGLVHPAIVKFVELIEKMDNYRKLLLEQVMQSVPCNCCILQLFGAAIKCKYFALADAIRLCSNICIDHVLVLASASAQGVESYDYLCALLPSIESVNIVSTHLRVAVIHGNRNIIDKLLPIFMTFPEDNINETTLELTCHMETKSSPYTKDIQVLTHFLNAVVGRLSEDTQKKVLASLAFHGYFSEFDEFACIIYGSTEEVPYHCGYARHLSSFRVAFTRLYDSLYLAFTTDRTVQTLLCNQYSFFTTEHADVLASLVQNDHFQLVKMLTLTLERMCNFAPDISEVFATKLMANNKPLSDKQKKTLAWQCNTREAFYWCLDRFDIRLGRDDVNLIRDINPQLHISRGLIGGAAGMVQVMTDRYCRQLFSPTLYLKEWWLEIEDMPLAYFGGLNLQTCSSKIMSAMLAEPSFIGEKLFILRSAIQTGAWSTIRLAIEKEITPALRIVLKEFTTPIIGTGIFRMEQSGCFVFRSLDDRPPQDMLQPSLYSVFKSGHTRTFYAAHALMGISEKAVQSSFDQIRRNIPTSSEDLYNLLLRQYKHRAAFECVKLTQLILTYAVGINLLYVIFEGSYSTTIIIIGLLGFIGMLSLAFDMSYK